MAALPLIVGGAKVMRAGALACHSVDAKYDCGNFPVLPDATKTCGSELAREGVVSADIISS
jgi:hypothetical protein